VGDDGSVAHRDVAQYGDGYQTISATPDEVATPVASVRAELEGRDRDPDMTISMLGPRIIVGGDVPTDAPGITIGGSPQEIIDRLDEYDRAGLQHALATPTLAGAPLTPERTMEAMDTSRAVARLGAGHVIGAAATRAQAHHRTRLVGTGAAVVFTVLQVDERTRSGPAGDAPAHRIASVRRLSRRNFGFTVTSKPHACRFGASASRLQSETMR
jgi:alkanesulfonate monooxygenase SsuD/methylene tetrahydromethanopterin reductase-like flavin-dependent oxidoreductase (luciferase family)